MPNPSNAEAKGNWDLAAGEMIVAADAAAKLSVITGYVQEIQKKGLEVNLVTDEIADTAEQLAAEMVTAIRRAVAAKLGR